MRPALTFFTLFIVSTVCALSQEKRGMTFMDVIEMRSVSNGTFSRDGKWFLYTHSIPDWKKAKSFSDLWLVSTEKGFSSSRQLTFSSEANESSPAWKNDHRTFFFLSDRNSPSGKTYQQVYEMRIDGGEARQVTKEKEGVSSYQLSRDDRWLVWLAGKDEKKHLWLLAADSIGTAKPKEITKRPVPVSWWSFSKDAKTIFYTVPDSFENEDAKRKKKKFDATIRNQSTAPLHVWALDLATLTEKRLTSGETYSVEGVSVSDDGRWVGFRGIRNDRFSRTITEKSNHGDLYLLSVDNGSVERLTDNVELSESSLSFSPDSRTIAFSAGDDMTYFRNQRVYVRSTQDAGKPFRKIGTGFDIDVTIDHWTQDGKSIVFSEGIGATMQVFSLNIASGEVTKLTDVPGVTTVSIDDDGHIRVTASSPTEPTNYYTVSSLSRISKRSSWMRLTDSNPQTVALALGETQTVQWTSTDGKTVEAVLVLPVGYTKGTQYPLVVQIHGGPAAATLLSFNAGYGYYSHVFASAGYVCLLPNYRGSSNYGESFRREIVGDYFRQGYEDIMTGVDHLIKEGIVDPARMGVMGWSAGGHWSNWILTHTDRFKAISSGAGTMNWTSMYAQSDIQRGREEYFGGKPYDDFEKTWNISPLKYIKNAKTPTMIHVVDGDPRVPRPQSEELHMALRQLGVPTEFVVYPGTTHGITQMRNQMFKMVTEFRWLDKWINGRETWFDWNELLSSVKDADSESEDK